MTATATLTFAITGMHCASCGMLIDETLEDLPGITRSQTTLKTATTVIHADNPQSIVDEVVAVIGELGYRAGLETR